MAGIQHLVLNIYLSARGSLFSPTKSGVFAEDVYYILKMHLEAASVFLDTVDRFAVKPLVSGQTFSTLELYLQVIIALTISSSKKYSITL